MQCTWQVVSENNWFLHQNRVVFASFVAFQRTSTAVSFFAITIGTSLTSLTWNTKYNKEFWQQNNKRSHFEFPANHFSWPAWSNILWSCPGMMMLRWRAVRLKPSLFSTSTDTKYSLFVLKFSRTTLEFSLKTFRCCWRVPDVSSFQVTK